MSMFKYMNMCICMYVCVIDTKNNLENVHKGLHGLAVHNIVR